MLHRTPSLGTRMARPWTGAVACAVLLSACSPRNLRGPGAEALPGPAAPRCEAQSLFNIPLGPEGVKYADRETQAWGPAAFTVAPDGSFWIADTAANRLLHYSARGKKLRTVSLEGLAVAPMDVEATGSEVLVLDMSAQVPSVLRLGLDGRLLSRQELPRELMAEGLSGIALGDDGQLLVERASGAAYARVGEGANPPVQAVPGLSLGGQEFSVQRGSPADPAGRGRGAISVGGRQVDISVGHELGTLQVLGANPDGSFYVLVEEVASTPAILVDHTVRHYSADGALLGVARVPLEQRVTHVSQGVAVGPSGGVYALVTRPDRVEVVELCFSQAPLVAAPCVQGWLTLQVLSGITVLTSL